MNKRFLAALLALTMVCALLPATALAADDDFVIDENGVLKKYNGPGGDVVIPDGVTAIGNSAFFSCFGLTSVTIPGGVISIGEGAFYNCDGLTSVTILKGMTDIGAEAFYNCTRLTSVTIPDSVTTIGNYAFSGCTSLTDVTIPEGVTTIGTGVFENCYGLTSVTIPASVTSVGQAAFGSHSNGSLTSISVADHNQHYLSQDGILFNKAKTMLHSYPAGKEGVYTIPDGVTSIGSLAFWGCTGLTDITIPASVTSIGRYAFWHCTGLTSITIPDSVTSIGDRVFLDCLDLTVHGYTGSETERYCVENDIPFVPLGVAPGTDQTGSLESDNGESVAWSITEEGEVTIDVTADLAPEEKILVGCYDSAGRFTGVKWLDAQHATAQIDPATPNVKLFWLGAAQNPLSPSVTVWGK